MLKNCPISFFGSKYCISQFLIEQPGGAKMITHSVMICPKVTGTPLISSPTLDINSTWHEMIIQSRTYLLLLRRIWSETRWYLTRRRVSRKCWRALRVCWMSFCCPIMGKDAFHSVADSEIEIPSWPSSFQISSHLPLDMRGEPWTFPIIYCWFRISNHRLCYSTCHVTESSV